MKASTINNPELSFAPITMNSAMEAIIHQTLARFETSKATRILSSNNAQTYTRQVQVACLAIMITVITAVSVIDVYWSFKTADILYQTEQNPIGIWLINLDGGDISLFMTAKMVGTMAVILSIPALFCLKRHWGLICGGAVAVFQCLWLASFEYGHIIFGSA